MNVTRYEAYSLGKLINSIGKHVRFLSPVTGEILSGIVRHIVVSPDNFCFPSGDENLENVFLRITLDTGFDVAYSVPDVIKMISSWEFSVDN